MKLAFITTINSLQEVSAIGQIEFALGPFLKRSKEYKQYFKDASKKGRYIILDNGIAEGDLIPTEELVNLAIEIKANEIIIPDIISDYMSTREMREDFLKKYYVTLSCNKIKIQSVIQGKTLSEYEKCLKEVEKDERIDVIGIPFRMKYEYIPLVTKEKECMLNRYYFIKKREFTKPIHLLGCNLIMEALLYNNVKSVRSMDSKLIARYAYNNKSISPIDFHKPEKKLFLHDELTQEQITLAIKNVVKLEHMKGGL